MYLLFEIKLMFTFKSVYYSMDVSTYTHTFCPLYNGDCLKYTLLYIFIQKLRIL